MKKQTMNPLVKYMKKHNISQGDFARLMGECRGAPVFTSAISTMVRSKNPPSANAQFVIEHATEGEVSRRMWKIWQTKTHGR